MPIWDRKTWTNWAGDIVVERPERRYYPTDLDELVAVVREAERHDPPQKVHASGSHWAFADVAVSPNWFVETNALRRTLYKVLSDALNERAQHELLVQDGTRPMVGYYHVEAGITIRDLNLRLDRRPVAADAEWAPMPLDQLAGGWAGTGKRWALPTMGGASGQTLAGALSTGTHGGDHHLPPMADFVEAIHLVGPGGRQWWIERDRGFTDPVQLGRLLPDVERHACTELFDAVLVSLGRMGVIYSLVIRVVEQFWLEQITTASTWHAQATELTAPFPAFSLTRPDRPGPNRFLEAVVLPYPRRDGHHTCYLSARWASPTECHPPASKGLDVFGWLCRFRSIAPVILTLIVLTAAALTVSWLVPLVGPILVSVEVVVLIVLVAMLPFSRLSVGDVVAAACNLADRTGRSWAVRRVLEFVIGWARPRVHRCDVGYEMADLSETGVSCYKADSMEASFDARSSDHADFLEQDVFPAFARSAKAGRTVAGYISLRFTGRSSALLAMQRWDVTCAVEVALLRGIDGNADVLHALEVAAIRRGGTIHWGQRNTTDAAAISQSFPDLARWRARLDQIIGAENPDTFDNAFCQTRGLTR